MTDGAVIAGITYVLSHTESLAPLDAIDTQAAFEAAALIVVPGATLELTVVADSGWQELTLLPKVRTGSRVVVTGAEILEL